MSTHDDTPRGQVISLFGGPAAARPETEPLRKALVAPDPPPFSDPRQARSATMLRSQSRRVLGGGGGHHTNLETGFAASAVDLGKLQEMLEESLAEWDMAAVHARWEVDLHGFLENTLLEHVQRIEELEVEPHESGIAVRMQTQDDRGSYLYGFDLFPGRRG